MNLPDYLKPIPVTGIHCRMRSAISDHVPRELRAELARIGMTQAQLASEVGVPQPWISRRLTGTVSMTLDDLDRINDALGRPVRLTVEHQERVA